MALDRCSSSHCKSYIQGSRRAYWLHRFICYVGIAYQLPGAISGERANGLTAHMKAMGLLDSARILYSLIHFLARGDS